MKKMTEAWLDAAQDDLSAANQLLLIPELTNLVAFHSQQCIEKVLKAILEEMDIPIVKTHDILRLYNMIGGKFVIQETEHMILLNELYVDSRYPGDLGLLPAGKPTGDEAKLFVNLASLVLREAKLFLKK